MQENKTMCINSWAQYLADGKVLSETQGGQTVADSQISKLVKKKGYSLEMATIWQSNDFPLGKIIRPAHNIFVAIIKRKEKMPKDKI